MRKNFALVLIIIFSNIFISKSQTLFQVTNLNFEKGIDSLYPASWTLPRKIEEAGYYAMLTKNNPAEGHLCMLLSSPDNVSNTDEIEKNLVPIYQIIDAIPYRGKKVKISAKARFESKYNTSNGQLWAIGRSTKDNITVSEYLEDNLIRSNDWKEYELIIDIPDETNELRFGVILQGIGKLWTDDFKIEVVQPKGSINERAKQLSDMELNNLTSLAKLYAYLNFFNPTNNLTTNESELLTFWAISNAENAKNQKELISSLNQYAQIMSPLAFVNNKKDTNIIYNKPDNSPEHLAVSMQHIGGPVERADDIFSSMSKNIFASNRRREASVLQVIDVVKYKEKKIKISASIKVAQKSPGANAQIWVKADRITKNDDNIVATTVLTPAMQNTWKRYELSIDLPKDVLTLKLALVFIGEGKASFDDVRIDVIENNKKNGDIPLANYSFETLNSNGFPQFWEFEPAVIAAGYSIYVDSSDCTKGKYSISMESDNNRIDYPLIGKIYTYSLDKSVYLHQPLVYYANDSTVIPKQNKANFSLAGKPKGYNPNNDDRLTRIASVIKLWSLIKHFSIKEIPNNELDSVLVYGLKTASASDKDFDKLIESILVITGDLRSRTWNNNSEYDFSYPFILRYFDNKYVISTNVDASLGLEIGDELIQIGDIKIDEYINNKISLIPGNNKTYKIAKALAEIRLGAKNSTQKFVFKKPDGTFKEVYPKREHLIQNIFEPKPLEVFELDTGYVYINITELSDNRFKDFIEPLSQRKAFIFDLRGMTSMSEHFLGLLSDDSLKNAKWDIPVYTEPDKNLVSHLIFGNDKIRANKKLSGKKNIFLIDEKTCAYAEAIASIVKSNKIGLLAGKPSAGNAAEVYPIRLLGGYNVSVSGLKVYSPDNKLLLDNPIIPDIEFNYELPDKNSKYDNFIKNALEILKK